jgi:prepilin-type N-terminal cleavage/methylation domain-containing protein
MSRRGQRAYTAVELMIAISIFAIGVSGIVAMQKATSVSNQHAKNLAIATHIAESWLDMLSTEAVMWNHPRTGDVGAPPPSDLGTDTVWLQSVTTNADGANNWFFPTYSGTRAFGPAFDALGDPINPVTNAAGIAFCSHLRLSWLYQPNANGNGLIRAEVRVFWARDGSSIAGACTAGNVAQVNGNTAAFHFVQKITAIRENN